MKRILVPTDFSKTAAIALDTAADVAKRSGAEVVLLHVIEEVEDVNFNTDGQISSGLSGEEKLFMLKLIEKSRKQLERVVKDPKYADIRLSGELKLGSAFNNIKDIIVDQKVDLVVMGSAGHTKLEEMLIGTNTEKVVRSSRSPVLVINKKPASLNFKNIVYATAMSKDEEVFSRIVKRTQQIYNSTVHLVRINTPGDFQRDTVVKDYMEKFAKKLGLKSYTINVFNDLTIEEGIIRFADHIDAELIAMATHGRTGFAHVLAGSVAEEVVSHAKRPVLTFVVAR
ncbi:MAG: universal stress protein [Cyclobacteriaceae bacterium]|jgi:nucleotide-binding universal stress UspA family protein|nr:universal stress protein [Cyclobacteriaceae bacterium]